MSLDYGESILNPFKGSAVDTNEKEIIYDFDCLLDGDDEKGEPYYVYFEKATVQAIAHQFFKKNMKNIY